MPDEIMNEEVVEEVETAEETPSDVEETESTEEETQVEEEPDYTEADKAFLDRFKVQFDGKDKTYENIDQLIEDAQMGGALPRYKQKLSEAESKLQSPHYKWIDEYMKDSGYSDGIEFVKAIQVNDKKASLVSKGMSEEDAQAEAEEYVNKTFGDKTDNRTKEINKFLEWHDSKVQSGKFKDSLDIESIPQKVKDAYENGENLKEAYMDYLLDDITVRTEQETLKKIQKNKETSTGKLKPSTKGEAKLSAEQIESKLSSLSSKEKAEWIESNWKMIESSGYFN